MSAGSDRHSTARLHRSEGHGRPHAVERRRSNRGGKPPGAAWGPYAALDRAEPASCLSQEDARAMQVEVPRVFGELSGGDPLADSVEVPAMPGPVVEDD